MNGTLPEDYWWNTLIPLQYTSLRKALLKGKHGVVSTRNSVTCLFPLETVSHIKKNNVTKVLLLAMSGRKEDEVVGEFFSPKLCTHSPKTIRSIISSFNILECLSVDARWVSEEDELEFVGDMICDANRRSLSLLHIAYANNTHFKKLSENMSLYIGKCSITIEFRESLGWFDTFFHSKVKMI